MLRVSRSTASSQPPSQLPGSAGGNIGGGTLTSVYDPAIEETNIASALSVFDAQLSTQLVWGKSTQPFNNAVNAGFFGGFDDVRFPVIFTQETGQFVAQVTKRTATGALMGVTHNINYLYSNSPTNVFPSVYTTNVQLSFSQPLLGGQFNTFPGGNVQAAGYAGLEANRAPIVIARLEADQAVWRLKSEVMAMVRSIEQQYWALAQEYVGSGQHVPPSTFLRPCSKTSWPTRKSVANVAAAATWPTLRCRSNKPG